MRANRLIEAALDDAAEAIAEVKPNDEGARTLTANDIAMTEGGEPVAGIVRFHNALRELGGRRGIRDDVSRYEAIGFGLVEMRGEERNGLLDSFLPMTVRSSSMVSSIPYMLAMTSASS